MKHEDIYGIYDDYTGMWMKHQNGIWTNCKDDAIRGTYEAMNDILADYEDNGRGSDSVYLKKYAA